MRTLLTSATLFAVLLIAACGSSGRVNYTTPQEAFGKGRALFEQRKYEEAVPYFQGVFSFGRTHQWAADAQLYLARTYAANKDYLLAANEYDRFTRIYRADPRIPLAHYEWALTYYQLSPNSELDQTNTRRAIEEFQLFIERYPADTLVTDAQERITELRSKLAKKQFETARLYERRDLYEAAAISYETVFDKYPDTQWAQQALVGAIRTYIAFADQSVVSRRPDRLNEAIKNYDRLTQIFGDSPYLKEAEGLYEQAQSRLDAIVTPAASDTTAISSGS
ncbi:MAG: outer membrane protein assembly factor BamD [Rhodothermales bacterium]